MNVSVNGLLSLCGAAAKWQLVDPCDPEQSKKKKQQPPSTNTPSPHTHPAPHPPLFKSKLLCVAPLQHLSLCWTFSTCGGGQKKRSWRRLGMLLVTWERYHIIESLFFSRLVRLSVQKKGGRKQEKVLRHSYYSTYQMAFAECGTLICLGVFQV